MRVIALETSGLRGSVALLQQRIVVEQRVLPEGPRSAQSLQPVVAAALAELSWSARDVELVAVAAGPGSFTGLRVGVTAAKLLAYAAGAELVAVDTLAAIAVQARHAGEVNVALNAYRQQVFSATFETYRGRIDCQSRPTATEATEDWLRRVVAEGLPVSGPVLSRLQPRLPRDFPVIADSRWTPQAATIGQLAWDLYEAGRRDDPFTLLPEYCRASAAEEKS